MDTNNYEIIVTNTARHELENIYEYISKSLLATEAATNLMNKIEKRILMLENNPFSCREIKIKPDGDTYRKLVIENYIVLYVVEEKDKKVIIYKVVYGRSDYLQIED